MRVHRFRCYHWPCGCPVDSLEDFEKKKSRGKRFGRSKLNFASVTHFQNPVLTKSAPDWDFAQILVHFRKTFPPVALTGKGSKNERSAMTSRSFTFLTDCENMYSKKKLGLKFSKIFRSENFEI